MDAIDQCSTLLKVSEDTSVLGCVKGVQFLSAKSVNVVALRVDNRHGGIQLVKKGLVRGLDSTLAEAPF